MGLRPSCRTLPPFAGSSAHVAYVIGFLSVGLRFRYCFFSRSVTGLRFASRYEVRRQQRLRGLSPQNNYMPNIQKPGIPKDAGFPGFGGLQNLLHRVIGSAKLPEDSRSRCSTARRRRSGTTKTSGRRLRNTCSGTTRSASKSIYSGNHLFRCFPLPLLFDTILL